MLKQYIDRDSSSVTPISVASSVPQEQSKMDSEDIYLIKSGPASSKQGKRSPGNATITKKGTKKVQEVPQLQTAALPRHQ